ncbi:YcbK family protein [Luteolibacter marinus]|uniref:YcbK family protein n=1 Tax=Luteolibacter marinus TaxID=2776705 RepID=UPI001868E312|nr:D-Ala-D-Ala carboxypeptidase family metallohydrolase [Luteolibacter marinus]
MLFSDFSGDPARSPRLTRRGAIGSLGAGAFALFASATPASALFGWKSKPRGGASLNLDELPAEWVERQGRTLGAYADYLGGLQLKRLTPQQVIAAHAKRHGSVWNTLPPKSLWKQMAPTLKVVDRLAEELGQPVKEIVSAYRSPAYNARCAGASSGSWHKSNVAVDVKFPVHASSVAAKARTMRARGLFRGGVGRYSSFTHIDTRGQNVDW